MLLHGGIDSELLTEPEICCPVAQILRFGERPGGGIFGIQQRGLSISQRLHRMGMVEIDDVLQRAHRGSRAETGQIGIQ
ncbi:hypothetical protein D3C76_1820850 [compost metagenome]